MNNENNEFPIEHQESIEQTPPKPFNFLDYIKNPEKTDEKKIEIHDYVHQLNEVNCKPKEIQPFHSFQNLSSLLDLDEDIPKVSQSVQDFGIHEINLENLEEYKRQNEEEEKEHQIQEENKEEEQKGANDENNEINNENNQPRFIYGHALEDIVFNVNNLRGQLNLLRRVTENAGIDTSYLQNIDQSFSMALNGIQQKFNERRELLINNQGQEGEQNVNFPEISEEMLNQMLQEFQSLDRSIQWGRRIFRFAPFSIWTG